MKKFLLLFGILFLTLNCAEAGILANVLNGFNSYNNDYYPPNIRYMNGNCYHPTPYPNNYYHRHYYNNNYYNPYTGNYYNSQPNIQYRQPYDGYYGRPIIYRTKVNRKSYISDGEKLVANQFSGIEKLEKQGIITGYSASINSQKLGYHITAFINLEISANQKSKFYPFISDCPNVLECDCVTGNYSMLIKVAFPCTEDLDDFIGELQTYGNTSTQIVFSTPVERRDIHIDEPKDIF